LEHGPVITAMSLLALTGFKDALLIVDSASVSVFHAVLAGALLAWFARRIREKRFSLPRLSWIEWALGTPILAGLWSLPTSVAPYTTVAYSGRLVMLWVAAIYVARVIPTADLRVRALRVFIVAGVALAAVATVQWVAPELGIGTIAWQDITGTRHWIVRPAGFFLDPNFLAGHLVLAAVAAVALASAGGRCWWWATGAIPVLVAIALTSSRTAWLTLSVGMAAVVVLLPGKVRLSLLGIMAAGLVGGVLVIGPGTVATRVGSLTDWEPGGSNATRVYMARATVRMIADRPVFGTGLEGFSAVYPEYRHPAASDEIAHPHQVAPALVAETGLGGLAAVLAYIAAMAAAIRRRVRSGLGRDDVALIAGLATVALGSFFQYFLYFESAWLFTGLLIGAARLTGAPYLGKE
jgi:hypothetical protein